MDALSLIANLIAVIGAAKDAAQTLEEVASFRHAPQQFLVLVNEIADFRTILINIQQTVSQLQNQNRELESDQYLKLLLGRALVLLEETNTITKSGLPSTGDATEPKRISRRWLLRNKGVLQHLQRRIHQMRMDFTSALTLISASEIPRTRVRLQEISLGSIQMGAEVDSVATHVLRPSLEKIQELLQNIQSHQSTLNASPALQNRSGQSNSTPGPIFRIRTAVESESSCSALCLCRCHKATLLSTPMWLQGFIGLLFLGYTGVPMFGRYKCSEKLCRRNKSALLTVNYYFPTWFLARMMNLRDTWTPTNGNLLTVRTPRVVSSTAPLFLAIQSRNLSYIQTLFSERKASPFDVSISAGSALRLAMYTGSLEITRFLLSEYSDPHQEFSSLVGSPVRYIWNRHLDSPCSSPITSIYNLLLPYIDEETEMANCGFTVLHQIVLKLRPHDLRSQLEVSTAEIDTKDARGWTPLFWACVRSDFLAINTLIDFGASLTSLTQTGSSILHTCVTYGSDDTTSWDILKRAADIRHDLSFENLVNLVDNNLPDRQTALCYTCTRGNIAQARWLIAHGASVDKGDPLLWAIQVNSHSIMELLLESGARTDLKDGEQWSLLHYAAIGDLETINILNRWKWKMTGVGLLDKDMNGHTPQETFDLIRPSFFTEDETTNRACREAFQSLLEGIEHLQAESLALESTPILEYVLDSETNSLHSGPEEWFDAESFMDE